MNRKQESANHFERSGKFLSFALMFVFLAAGSPAQEQTFVVPTIITNHYDTSEPESHGVITVQRSKETVTVDVRDLSAGQEYEVVLLNESNGHRNSLGTFKTDTRGSASKKFSAGKLLKEFNALLIVRGDDVIQYAQLHEAHHGCICRHSGGTIVTRRLDQDCYECPCGVKYEICCGGPKNHENSH